MAVSIEFIEYILDQLDDWREVSYKKMFGGAGIYADELMFAVVADDVLYFKVDDSNRAMYEEEGSEPFKPFADKPMTMSYYELPIDIVENREKFIEWAEISYEVQMHSKTTKKSKKK